MSQDSYKETYKELTERIQCASAIPEWKNDYIKGLQVVIDCACRLEIQGIDYFDDPIRIKTPVYTQVKVAVVAQDCCYSVRKGIKQVFKYVLSTLYRKFLEVKDDCKIAKDKKVIKGTDEFDEININIDHNNLIVWDGDYVYIWHTEQECGEGWISAPVKPVYIMEQATFAID